MQLSEISRILLLTQRIKNKHQTTFLFFYSKYRYQHFISGGLSNKCLLKELTPYGNQFLSLWLKIKGTVKLNSCKNLITARKATLNLKSYKVFLASVGHQSSKKKILFFNCGIKYTWLKINKTWIINSLFFFFFFELLFCINLFCERANRRRQCQGSYKNNLQRLAYLLLTNFFWVHSLRITFRKNECKTYGYLIT